MEFPCGSENPLLILARVASYERDEFELIAAGGASETVECSHLISAAVDGDDKAVFALAEGTIAFPLTIALFPEAGQSEVVDKAVYFDGSSHFVEVYTLCGGHLVH